MFVGTSPITFTSPSSEARQKVRALCSAGITQLRRSYYPVRLPPWPSPSATLRTLPSPLTVSPDYPNHLSDVPCPLPRRIERVRVSIASHARWSLPRTGAHNAGCRAFEVLVTYPFHPLVGQSVLVVVTKNTRRPLFHRAQCRWNGVSASGVDDLSRSRHDSNPILSAPFRESAYRAAGPDRQTHGLVPWEARSRRRTER